jgi:hypothetical protein
MKKKPSGNNLHVAFKAHEIITPGNTKEQENAISQT